MTRIILRTSTGSPVR